LVLSLQGIHKIHDRRIQETMTFFSPPLYFEPNGAVLIGFFSSPLVSHTVKILYRAGGVIEGSLIGVRQYRRLRARSGSIAGLAHPINWRDPRAGLR
jgi:hypothetical protein